MSENQSSGSPNLGLIAIAAVVAIVVVVGGFFVLSSQNEDRQASSASNDSGTDEPTNVAAVDHLTKTEMFGGDGGFGTGIYALDKVEGQADAPFTIIEYLSWTCPACRAFHAIDYKQTIKPAIEAGHVKFISREFLRNPVDFRVAMAARCDGIDFVQAADALFGNQSAYSTSDMAAVDMTLISILSPFGMTQEKYVGCITDENLGGFVKAMSDEGARRGINSTPTVFINGRRAGNAEWDDLAAQLQELAEQASN